MAKQATKPGKPKLTPKQEAFCCAYVGGKYTGEQAAVQAGYKAKNAYAQSSENLGKPHIQARIAELRKEVAARSVAGATEVFQGLQQIGMVDPLEAYDDDGLPLPLKDVPAHVRRAIVSIDHGEDGRPIRYVFANRLGALNSMGKSLGMFVEKKEITGPDGGPVQVESQGPPSALSELSDDELMILEKGFSRAAKKQGGNAA